MIYSVTDITVWTFFPKPVMVSLSNHESVYPELSPWACRRVAEGNHEARLPWVLRLRSVQACRRESICRCYYFNKYNRNDMGAANNMSQCLAGIIYKMQIG